MVNPEAATPQTEVPFSPHEVVVCECAERDRFCRMHDVTRLPDTSQALLEREVGRLSRENCELRAALRAISLMANCLATDDEP